MSKKIKDKIPKKLYRYAPHDFSLQTWIVREGDTVFRVGTSSLWQGKGTSQLHQIFYGYPTIKKAALMRIEDAKERIKQIEREIKRLKGRSRIP